MSYNKKNGSILTPSILVYVPGRKELPSLELEKSARGIGFFQGNKKQDYDLRVKRRGDLEVEKNRELIGEVFNCLCLLWFEGLISDVVYLRCLEIITANIYSVTYKIT